MSITLSKSQEKRVIDEARSEATERFFRHLIAVLGENPVISITQASAYLNVTTQTLRKLPIDSYNVTGDCVGYRIKDLDAYLEARKIKGGKA